MKFRKKPVVIEAIQYIFDEQNNTDNVEEICTFMSAKGIQMRNQKILIPTLEGAMWASSNDYIIKGVNGEFYPCKPDIFEKTYEIKVLETEDLKQRAQEYRIRFDGKQWIAVEKHPNDGTFSARMEFNGYGDTPEAALKDINKAHIEFEKALREI